MTDLPTSLPCSTATFRKPHPPHDWEPQPGMIPVHCPGCGGPAATDRPSLEDLDAAPDDGPWCCTGNAEDCALCTDPNPNYPWICPGHERTAANERIVAEVTRPAEQPTQPWTQLEARAFNAVLPALREAGEWLPMSVRRKVARAVLAEIKPELDDLDRYEEVVGELNEANTGLARDLANAIRERDERQWRAEEGQRTTRIQRERAERAEAALREVLDLFTPASTLRADGTVLTYSTTDVIDAARMTRWRAALGELLTPDLAGTHAAGEVKTLQPTPYPREMADDEAPMRDYLRADQHQPEEQP
ncbi:hypothetical protein ACFWMH_27625 [Streptomyces tendae]|uniref:hypothetical protein n=1 Tax=Streptomyces tendae TaxID=1932 RepID=UPI00365470D3